MRGRLEGDELRLVIPAAAHYSRVARVAVSGLGARLGLRFAQIEDLRLAVDETLILLLRPEGASGNVVFTFHIAQHELTIDAATTAGSDQHWLDAGARARFEQLVGPVVDAYEIDEEGTRVHLVKALPT
ncbi:MAG: hypothetical protein WHS89_06470 [Acidimicrobiales bacterium]